MPRTRSLKWSELKIGIMAVVALFIAAALILALGGEGGFFWQRYNLKVKFSERRRCAAGLAGARRRRDGRRRHGHPVRRVRSRDGCSSCAKTCRTSHGRRRAPPSASVSLLGEGAVDITATTTGQPIPEWGYVPSDAPPPQLADVTAQANRGITELTALIQDIRAGKGTVGKLMTDEQLYADLQQFTAAAREVTDGLSQGQGHARPAAEQPGERAQLEASLKNLTAITEQNQRRARAVSAS